MIDLSHVDWDQIKNAMPFVALSAARSGEKIERPIVTRVVEVSIISLVSGASAAVVAAIITMNVMENDLKHLSKNFDKFAAEVHHDIDRLESFHMGNGRP